MTAVGVKLQVFNWRLWQARRGVGLTQAQLGLMTGITTVRLSTIETLKSRPTAEEQDEIAGALNVAATELFPPEVLDLYGSAASTIRLAVPASRLRELRDAGHDVDPARLVTGLPELVAEAVSTLTPRAQRVIRQRFGLDDEEGKAYEAIGYQEGVTRERIRQIEANALRDLRRSMRSKFLRPYLADDDSGRIPQGRAPTLAERRAEEAADRFGER